MSLVISWRNGSPYAEKVAFTNKSRLRRAYDHSVECKLKEGTLDLCQAVTLLGTPKDMMIKENTQVIRYSYDGNMLRLFFRNRALVDYALVESRIN